MNDSTYRTSADETEENKQGPVEISERMRSYFIVHWRGIIKAASAIVVTGVVGGLFASILLLPVQLLILLEL